MALEINNHKFELDSLEESLKKKELSLKTDPESVLKLWNSYSKIIGVLDAFCDNYGISLEGEYAEAYDTLYESINSLVDQLMWSCDQIDDNENNELCKALKYKG